MKFVVLLRYFHQSISLAIQGETLGSLLGTKPPGILYYIYWK